MSRVLAISGSLRAVSANSALLHAAGLVAPPGMTIIIYDGLASLPPFNPDDDAEGMRPPEPVAVLRALVGESDALLISSPEYAHGVPGTLKNALDWLVSAPEFYGIAIGLVNASLQSFHAHDSLAETLRTMGARLPADATVRIPITNRGLDARALADDPAVATPLRAVLRSLAEAGGRRPDAHASPPTSAPSSPDANSASTAS